MTRDRSAKMHPRPRRDAPRAAAARSSPLPLSLTTLLLAVALLTGFYLRISAADHEYISQWDEAYHALVAKQMVAHPLVPTLHEQPLFEYDFRDWTGNHIWLHKPPLPLWLMALSVSLAGEGEMGFRLPAVFLGTLSILLTFLIARALGGPAADWVGATAASLHALNPLMIRLVSGTVPTDHVDLITVFFVQLAFLLCARAAQARSAAAALLAGVGLGLAFLCKSIALLAVLPACALVAWSGPRPTRAGLRRLALALLGLLVVASPWQVYCAARWPAEFAWESQYSWRHLWEPLEGHAHAADWYLELLPVHYGGAPGATYALLLAAILGGLALAVRARKRRFLVLVVWALLPYLLFSAVKTKLYAYVATAAPAVLLLVGGCGVWLFSRLPRRGPRSAAGVFGVRAAAVLVGIVGLIHVGSVAAERFTARYDACPWNVLYDYPSFRRAMLEIGRAPGSKVIFNVGDAKEIQAMYYAACPAYARVPTPREARALLEGGWRIYLLLDEVDANRERILDLHEAGLLAEIQPVPLPAVREGPPKSPYFN